MIPQDLLTIPEVCGQLNINRRQFDQLRAAGLGPPITQLGRRALVTVSDLSDWIEGDPAGSTNSHNQEVEG